MSRHNGTWKLFHCTHIQFIDINKRLMRKQSGLNYTHNVLSWKESLAAISCKKIKVEDIIREDITFLIFSTTNWLNLYQTIWIRYLKILVASFDINIIANVHGFARDHSGKISQGKYRDKRYLGMSVISDFISVPNFFQIRSVVFAYKSRRTPSSQIFAFIMLVGLTWVEFVLYFHLTHLTFLMKTNLADGHDL